MKRAYALIAIVAIAVAIWLILDPTIADSRAAGTERPGASKSVPEPAGLPSAPTGPERNPTEAEPGPLTVQRESVSLGGGLFGRTVDEGGNPVAGAGVYLVPSSQRGPGRPTILAETQTNMQGEFSLPSASWELGLTTAPPLVDLGVVANGYLRSFVEDAVRNQPAEGLRIVLERGQMLAGYVIDENGRPVPGMELFAHAFHTGIDHVSMSQTLLRADRENRGHFDAGYHQCRARTDAAGFVRFSGLSSEFTLVRSIDPGWALLRNPLVSPTDLDLLLTAAPRLGVRLTVLDERTGKPVDRVRAIYSVELTFADGSVEEYGQWIGWGKGGSSFALSTEILPQLKIQPVIRAVFFGTVDIDEAEAAWRSDPIEGDFAAVGVAEVRVEIDPSSSIFEEDEEDKNAEPEPALLDLDVRYTDGTPFEGRLYLIWSTSEGELAHRGSELMDAWSPGHYRTKLVDAEIDLKIRDWNVYGSLPVWTGRVRCRSGAIERAHVVLPRGAAVTILRPEGWTGKWFIRSSWREPGSESWQASKIYNTTENRITPYALRSAEWRFQLSRESGQGPDSPIRTVVVSEGDAVTVQG